MGFISDMTDDNKLVEASFYNKDRDFSSGQITESFPDDPDLTTDVLFWTGKAAERAVSDKLKAEVSGVITMDYEQYTVTINDGAKVTINSKDYSVIYVDNVANQNEIIQIAVKNF